MNKKSTYTCGSILLTLSLLAGAFTLAAGKGVLLSRATDNASWVHYTATEPTYTEYGTKEYWVQCGGAYQFSAPISSNIQHKTTPDTSEFTINDPRWNKDLIPYSFDQSNYSTVVGAKAYNATANDDQTWWGASYACLKVLGTDSLKYKQYDLNNFIEYFPRINFRHYYEVKMDITLNIWKSDGGIKLGFTESAFQTGAYLATSTDTGRIIFTSHGDYVNAKVTYAGATVIDENITNTNIINGSESIKLYITGTSTGDFYMTITNFVANVGHVHTWGNWITDSASTYTSKGSKHHECLECHEVENVELELLTYEAGYLYPNPYCGDNVVQLLLPEDFPLTDGYYGVGDNSTVVIKHDDVNYPLLNASNDTISVATNGSERYLQFNFGRLGYHTIGSWYPGTDLSEGDTITIDGTFIGLDNANLGQNFRVNQSTLYTKTITDTTKHFYFLVPINSLDLSEDSWMRNNYFQFYSDLNAIPIYSDTTNVGKFRPMTADAIKVLRQGVYYNVGKNNDGWYSAIQKENNTRYIVDFASNSLNVAATIGSIQSGDVVILDGLFISPVTNERIYVKGAKPLFIQTNSGTNGWAVREYNETSAEQLKIGVWNGSYHFGDDQQLADIAEQGINVIIGVNPFWTTESKWLHTLNVADSLGIKFIVDPREYRDGSYQVWDGTCPSYANHNAVLGFQIWDEPSTTNYEQIASLKAQFDAVMPKGKLFFVNLFGSAVALDYLYGTTTGKQSTATFYENNYAKPFYNTVNPDLFSWDSYPLFTDGMIRKSYFVNFDIWSYLGKQYDIPVWYTLLAAGHNSGDGKVYITPTDTELRWQMSVAMTYGIQNMLHYIYATTDTTYTCMANLSEGKIVSYSDVFYDMGNVNNEFHNWEETYLYYNWEGTGYYSTGSYAYHLSNLNHSINLSNYGISSTSAGTNLLIGAFSDPINRYAYMVTNAGKASYGGYVSNVSYSNVSTSVTLNLASSVKGVKIIQNGISVYQAVNGTAVTFNLDAYGSAFVIPVY